MPSSSRVQLHGPRPAVLEIGKDSHHVKKKGNSPVIIHVQAPKVIHASLQDFMDLVQRLTGKNSLDSPPQNSDTTSESHENDSKRHKEKQKEVRDGTSEGEDPLLLTLGQSPSMRSIPLPVSPGFFSCSPNTSACLQDFGLLS